MKNIKGLSLLDILVAMATIGILLTILIPALAEAQATSYETEELTASVLTYTGDASIYCNLDGELIPLEGKAVMILDNHADHLLITGTLKDDQDKAYTLLASYQGVYEDSPEYYSGYRYAGYLEQHVVSLMTIDGRLCEAYPQQDSANNVLEWTGSSFLAWINLGGSTVDLSISSIQRISMDQDIFEQMVPMEDFDNLFAYAVKNRDSAAAWKARAEFIQQQSMERIARVHALEAERDTLKLGIRALESYLGAGQ